MRYPQAVQAGDIAYDALEILLHGRDLSRHVAAGFLHQCVGVGWWSGWGYSLTGHSNSRAWSRARNALKEIKVGDNIVVSLRNHRVGRIGEVTGKAVEDTDWDPLVPRSTSVPDGEMGRRIFVRWDLTCGPESRDWVVALPEEARFTQGEIRLRFPRFIQFHCAT
jgi:hypothetical protein